MKRFGRTGGVMGALLVVMMVFVVPIVLYKMIPLARREVADYYVQAAQDWKQATKDGSHTPGPYAGVLVDWQEVIAIDGVERNQDFRDVTYADAYATTQRFTWLDTWTETECHTDVDPVTGDEEEHCTTYSYWKYVPYTMDQVMDNAGFTQEQKDWAYELAHYARLLVKDDIQCHYDQADRKWVCTE